jgi:hypothetical protein
MELTATELTPANPESDTPRLAQGGVPTLAPSPRRTLITSIHPRGE